MNWQGNGGGGMQVPRITPVVKKLLIANVVIWFIFQLLLEKFARFPFTSWFSLIPQSVLLEGQIWRIFTYMFLHAKEVNHILFNMLMLYFFGGELEERFGSKKFLYYYLGSGAGAALIYVMAIGSFAWITGRGWVLEVPVVGASGALYALLLAQGILFGERIISVMMLFPMKMKHFVLGMGAIQFASMLSSGIAGGEVAYVAHLGGILSGFIGLKILQWTKQKPPNKKGGSKLRLVVDNEKGDKPPKYWN